MSLRTFFALLFAVSLAVFLYFQFYPKFIDSTEVQPVDKKTQTYQKPRVPSVNIEAEITSNDKFIMIASLIASILSFFGFLISTYFSFRGHRREEELFSLKAQREQLEMERIQEEINALKSENNIR